MVLFLALFEHQGLPTSFESFVASLAGDIKNRKYIYVLTFFAAIGGFLFGFALQASDLSYHLKLQ